MIQQEVYRRIQELDSIVVDIESKKLKLLKDLKSTPRTGKSVRIDKFKLPIPKRSIYDHLVSLGFQADMFLGCVGKLDKPLLINLIVFHDLAESITGDIPDFTTRGLAGELYETKEGKRKMEIEANKLIYASLPKYKARLFKSTIKTFTEGETPTVKFFNMLDKTDPIIAIWRYIYRFKQK